jgi:hypothetical protein
MGDATSSRPFSLSTIAVSMAWEERAKLITEVMSSGSLSRQVGFGRTGDNARIVADRESNPNGRQSRSVPAFPLAWAFASFSSLRMPKRTYGSTDPYYVKITMRECEIAGWGQTV